MNLFGWSMEAANGGRVRADRSISWFGCIAGIVDRHRREHRRVRGPTGCDADPGVRLWAIYGSLFIAFNVFALTMVLRYAKVGRWREYLIGDAAADVTGLVPR